MISFAYPLAFVLVALPWLVKFLCPRVKEMHGDALKVPFFSLLQEVSKHQKNKTFALRASSLSFLWFLSFAVYVLLVTAIARPQWLGEPIRLKSLSRDILLVMDISPSMREMDFALNGKRIDRMQAVKISAQRFLDERLDDRIGLVLFGTNAYLQVPLTFDKNALKETIRTIRAGMAGRSTALGDALGVAVKNIREKNNEQQKIIILLTDGENNDGRLNLPQAIKLAQDENVKIYTIGVGAENMFAGNFFGLNIGNSGLDEKSLKEIADLTKGRYFRAQNTQSLFKIYEEIDKSEPQSLERQFARETKDLFYYPLLLAFVLACWGILTVRKERRK